VPPDGLFGCATALRRRTSGRGVLDSGPAGRTAVPAGMTDRMLRR